VEGQRLVALAYKEESGEENPHSEEDIHNNWVRKLCNNLKNPQVPPETWRTGSIAA
jgi:hypothetical protein